MNWRVIHGNPWQKCSTVMLVLRINSSFSLNSKVGQRIREVQLYSIPTKAAPPISMVTTTKANRFIRPTTTSLVSRWDMVEWMRQDSYQLILRR